MKRILVLSGMLIFGCRSSPEVSFNNLTKAFISWHFRYLPVESSRFNMPNHHGEFKLYGISGRDEYYADISRFLIELSQIDATKISHSARVDYNILYSRLECMKYVMEHIRPWEWNPLWILNEINQGLFLLSNRHNLYMVDRVDGANERIKQIPELLQKSKDLIKKHSKSHIEYINASIESILVLLQYIPLKLNSDNITLDDIDHSISLSVSALNKYKKWINQNSGENYDNER